jgi:predicted amidophosphoribosyltransferase
VNYREFGKPTFDVTETTETWLDWLDADGHVLLPVAPHHERSCRLCFGASGYLDGGPETWPLCPQCHGYDDAVDHLVPMAYSIDAGLESMLHRYKDRGGYEWLRKPLASLVHQFVGEHGDCIDSLSRRGRFDVATIVPSDGKRSFDHLDSILRGIVKDNPVWARWDWDTDFLKRDTSTSRPGRGQLKPSAYIVEPFIVESSSVLLFDDTWTSGSSAASCAAALKEAGATDVTVLTLGRQLNATAGFGSSEEIYDDVSGVYWELRECVVCA